MAPASKHWAAVPRLWVRRATGLSMALIVPLAAWGLVALRVASHSRPAAEQTLEATVGYSNERWTALLSAQRSAVAQCMKKRGFRYVPDADPYYDTAPHGLFDLDTLSAEDVYLAQHGFGVVAIANALRSRMTSNEGLRDQAAYDALSSARRRAFVRAFQGDDTKPGCSSASVYGLPRGFLPDGGALGDAYAGAWATVRASSAYSDWSRAVAGCMAEHGAPLAGDDLSSAGRPALVGLIRAADGEMSVDPSGRLHYSIDASRLTSKVRARLPALGRLERRLADVELSCRKQFKSAESALSRDAASGLAADYPEMTDHLRLALFEAGTSHE